MEEGIYEQIITKLVRTKIETINADVFYIKEVPVDRDEASLILSRHLFYSIKQALNLIKNSDKTNRKISIANKIIRLLRDELENVNFEDDIIENEGSILKGVFTKADNYYSDMDLKLSEITPYTRLTHSELFTGSNKGISLESEIRKEILSSDKIDLIVSFIKFSGIRILEPALKRFVSNGGQLRIITTTYMGASDYKAIKLLSNLPNTTIKISYNTGNERLHAKAYLFKRNTGFHTAYIGSSNFSRSALTNGLEWNIKITTKEVPHIIEKFEKIFDSYWENRDFEIYDDKKQQEKLIGALKEGGVPNISNSLMTYFDLKPYPFQEEILEKLEVERTVHKEHKNLVVAATGTGKTMIAAFDYKRFKITHSSSKLLFIAHRKEILHKSLQTFQAVLKDQNFGEFWGDGKVPASYNNVFASVQTVKNQLSSLDLSPDYYDYIIIDECHHSTASSYRTILEYFKPKILLGLTATPERMSGEDIKEDFGNRIAAEIRLPEALNNKLLCPFHYFGISDSIDLSGVTWEKGKYKASELTKIYTKNDIRVGEIISGLEKYTNDINEVRALCFCAGIKHAQYMAEKFTLAGLSANFITGNTDKIERIRIRRDLEMKTINYLFVVDIFNEGVDIPEIDTVLFLRPTESLTVFLQQLGRGLRLSEDKDCLTVLDFVGNAKPEYNFENKFRALIGKTNSSVIKEIEDEFPHLPLGCSIILEKIAKKTILNNIRNATRFNRNQLIEKIKTFNNKTDLKLTLANFIDFTNIPLQTIYKKGCWSRLCQIAGKIPNFPQTNEKEIISTIGKKWLSCKSSSYFNFLLSLTKKNFDIKLEEYSESEQKMLLMLHYDFWQKEAGFKNLEESVREIGANKILVKELKEVLEILIDKIDFKEYDISLPYVQPLKVHARYTRDQILAGFGSSTFEKKSSNREGTAENKKLNTEILFINLIKSEENFSPTTMYDDYAVTESLFHWQTQNSARPDIGKGLSYIQHQKNEKIILLFLREQAKDEYENTIGYVFIGRGKLKDYSGSKPMNINWELEEPLPKYIWNESAKLIV
ncbi:DUF3427 domain-containing protein [Dokdonia sp. Dokd-P16]|uniref:DEAD/DEAH box helicase n=1 Tax=Dokdonia sp. Dokd-P16 TaxID=2173169 RepID=UPI000D549E4B|nr:DEAD/DEAH box helicase [Dokdonia sp. Dokd-P16]AWH75083.1 DUF3427 domain-containing protein [Dokdonia sp. Dokd-P16]